MDSISKTDRTLLSETPNQLSSRSNGTTKLDILSATVQPPKLENHNPWKKFSCRAKGPWIQSPEACDTSTKSHGYFSNFPFSHFSEFSFPHNCRSPRCEMHLGTLQTSTNSKLFTFNVLLANKVLLLYFHRRKVCKRKETPSSSILYF